LVKLSEQALRYDLFCPKTILYQTRHLRIRLRLWPLNEEIEVPEKG
jgi:hypothetical protein